RTLNDRPDAEPRAIGTIAPTVWVGCGEDPTAGRAGWCSKRCSRSFALIARARLGFQAGADVLICPGFRQRARDRRAIIKPRAFARVTSAATTETGSCRRMVDTSEMPR